MQSGVYLDTRRMIADLGGASVVAQALGLCRTTPYSWAKRSGPSAPTLAKLKAAFPELNIDNYFVTGERI